MQNYQEVHTSVVFHTSVTTLLKSLTLAFSIDTNDRGAICGWMIHLDDLYMKPLRNLHFTCFSHLHSEHIAKHLSLTFLMLQLTHLLLKLYSNTKI